MGKLDITTPKRLTRFVLLVALLLTVFPTSARAEPIAPILDIAITPVRLRPAQAGMIMVTGGYPLLVEATMDGEPIMLAWSGESYIGTFSFGFDEPEGEYQLQVTATDPATGERIERSESVFVSGYEYPTEVVALPFSLIPLLEPTLNQEEQTRLAEVYATQSRQTGLDFPFAVPVPDGIVTSSFGGDRTYNGGIWQAYHTGADFRRRIGESVIATADGIVVEEELFDVRGNVVIIHHGLGIYSQYAHLSDVVVREGDFVRQGELVGLAGATGRINGPHLHFEIIVDGHPVDPIRWLALAPGFVAPPQLPPRQASSDGGGTDAVEVEIDASIDDLDGETPVDEPTPIPETPDEDPDVEAEP